MGFFGLSYAEENAEAVKLLAVDNGSGCIHRPRRPCRTAPTPRWGVRCSST